MKKSLLLFGLAATVAFTSCKKDDDDPVVIDPTDTGIDLDVPSTYAFLDDEGQSTVSYSGQTDRLNQLAEMKALMETKHADKTASVTADQLNKMFANEAGAGFTFTSTKQLKNKAATGSTTEIESWFTQFEDSDSLVERESKSSYVIINDNGQEIVQLVEKGIMGAVFFHQAVDNYLLDLTADDNTTNVTDKNYTERAHHFDEAFGYFGAPVDYPTSAGSYHAKYATTQGLDQKIMAAFLKGRAAIAAGQDDIMVAQVKVIRDTWEQIIAQQAISYLESSLAFFGKKGDLIHPLSEAYAFIWSLHFKDDAKITDAKINELLADIEVYDDLTQQKIQDVIDALEAIYVAQ